jgi:hypothetical protein
MSDAKSRYEIVDELVNKKLSMIDAVSKLKEEESAMVNRIEQTKRTNDRTNKANEKNYLLAVENEKIRQASIVEDLIANHVTYQTIVQQKTEDYNTKIQALDVAIEAIKAISSNQEKKE